MRPRRKTYLYKDGEYIGEYPSIKAAAERAEVNEVTARNIALGNTSKMTRKGYTFSFNLLTEEEQEQLRRIRDEREMNKGTLVKEREQCKQVIDRQEFEVDCDDGLVFYLPRKLEERKNMIMRLFITELQQGRYPRKIAVMKKQFLRELLNNI